MTDQALGSREYLDHMDLIHEFDLNRITSTCIESKLSEIEFIVYSVLRYGISGDAGFCFDVCLFVFFL